MRTSTRALRPCISASMTTTPPRSCAKLTVPLGLPAKHRQQGRTVRTGRTPEPKWAPLPNSTRHRSSGSATADRHSPLHEAIDDTTGAGPTVALRPARICMTPSPCSSGRPPGTGCPRPSVPCPRLDSPDHSRPSLAAQGNHGMQGSHRFSEASSGRPLDLIDLR